MSNRFLVLILGAAVLTIGGCGDDETTSSPASSYKTPAASTSADGTSDASTPGGAVAATDGEITVKAAEMSFTPSTITASPGKLKITLDNTGTMEHELVVLKTDAAADALPVKDGQVSEADSVGEIADVEAGATKSHTFDLKPGHYVIVCNVPGHYAAGMRGELVVE